jgi:hypothetical protein
MHIFFALKVQCKFCVKRIGTHKNVASQFSSPNVLATPIDFPHSRPLFGTFFCLFFSPKKKSMATPNRLANNNFLGRQTPFKIFVRNLAEVVVVGFGFSHFGPHQLWPSFFCCVFTFKKKRILAIFCPVAFFQK